MGRAYSYCPRCSGPLAAATVDDIVNDVQACPSCGVGLTPNRTRDDALRDLANEVEAIRETVRGMTQ